MKTLLIVTHVDFWRKGAGHRSRLSALIHYLKDHFEITVVYFGTFTERDAVKLNEEFPGVKVVVTEPARTITFKEHGQLFQSFVAGKTFDAALIEYIELAFVLPIFGERTMTLLDTHDLVGDRMRSFAQNNVPYGGIDMSDQEELDIFDCFDKVLLIQEQDYEKIGKQIGFDKVVLVPHAARLTRRTINKEAKNIAFIASEYMPNVKAISWFLQEVWPAMERYPNVHLNIYGNVCARIPEFIKQRSSCTTFHGFVPDVDSAYDTADIIINPVKAGAGLKVKNIEALSCGLPLITTSHGASGITEGINKSFLVADTAAEFISAMERLIGSESLRKELGASAHALVEEKFSSNACYQELVNTINEYHLAV